MRSCTGCSGAIEEKSKFGDICMFPEKRSHAGSGGGVGDVRFEIVGCIYCEWFEKSEVEAERLYPLGAEDCDVAICCRPEPDRAEYAPGVGTGGDVLDEEVDEVG